MIDHDTATVVTAAIMLFAGIFQFLVAGRTKNKMDAGRVAQDSEIVWLRAKLDECTERLDDSWANHPKI